MEAKDNITCKVVLVGESGVGKTCIIQRYVNNNFNENVESTIASTYTYKTIDYKKLNKSNPLIYGIQLGKNYIGLWQKIFIIMHQ